jgi:YtkA-like
MITPIARTALFLALVAPAAHAPAQHIRADLDCTFTGTDFVYDCVIRLEPPKAGVRISVGADMPSMPMAHNIKPVRAKPGKAPGEYHARLDLEMPGEWAVKLRLSGAVRELLVLNYVFPETDDRSR